MVLGFGLSMQLHAQVTTVSYTVNLDTDDQEEEISSGALDIASSDLELSNEGGSSEQIIGIRFNNINIPQGAIIKNAYVQFTCDDLNSGATTIIFRGEASDSAHTFAQTSGSVSSRTTGLANASWTIEPWTVIQERGAKQRSSNIKSVVQEIINRSGWKANNALALIITGAGEREAESFEGAAGHGNPAYAPTLIIEYVLPLVMTSVVNLDTDDQEEEISSGALDIASSDLELSNEGGSSEQVIGIRFNNVNIPQGAYITRAYVQFTCDDLNSGATTITFRGEASDSAHTFAQTSGAVSSRATGLSSTSWTIDPWTVIQERGPKQKSADIKNVIQEIISRGGWKANNALALIITGAGEREAESFEGAAGHGNPAYAPALIVEYIIPTVLTSAVSIDTDDQEEEISSGALDIASSDLELSNEGGSSEQIIGIRFNNINIPQGAYITKAHVQFTCDDLNSGATTITFRGEASDSAHTFAQTAFSVSSRSTGSKSASWTIDPWTVIQERGTKQRSTDIKNVIQEIISRGGWKENNSLALIITGSGEREAESFEGATGHGNLTYVPTITIEYVDGVTPPVEDTDPPVGVFPVPAGAMWKYLDNGTDQGTSWKDTTFNATSWAYGPAELGYGDGGEATLVGYGSDGTNKYITTYFRHTFNATADDLAKMDSLLLRVVRDDGAVIYLNGNEIVRSNMPAGAINHLTLASSNVAGGSENTFYSYTISKEFLVAGKNYLAVEIHQDAVTTSDLSFKLILEGRRYNKTILPVSSSWKYDDSGTDKGTGWKEITYDDASWASGNAVLGYGNGDEATTLSYGNDVTDKHITSYFRKSFTVIDTAGYPTLELKLKRDDGAIVYINGTEVYRNNIISGTVNYNTPALTYVEAADEDIFYTVYLDKSVLTYGSNVVAVEVHQSAATSTDLRFDLGLALSVDAASVSYAALNITCDPASSDAIGCFTSVKPTAQQSTFVYPSLTHIFQVLMKSQDSTYDKGAGLVPNGNDFTGFIPDNGSSTKGWLSVNHENSPGGVSVMDIHYNAESGLWMVDSINKVDFSGVVKTERNCSGGVTPWGTVITSEETYSTGDANADGYTDLGWQVEVDPKTRTVVDHDGDGTPDKLWALGRMSHENIALASDSLTAYEAEDGGTGCVYKFVASQKTNLSVGTLYVLKRDNPTATTGTWIEVPNTTQTQCNTTRDLASSLGGTNWGGCEDVEIGPLDGKIYFTEKGQGTTWRFTDNGTTVSDLEAWLTNTSYPIVHEGGSANEPWNTGNDNLDFDGEGNLWVLQDGGRDHIWMVKPDHTSANPKVELFATSPQGSEPTGITFSPDYKFMFISFQNPASANRTIIKDAAGKDIVFNASTTVVISRKNNLGAGAVVPAVSLGSDKTICDGASLTLNVPVADVLTVWNDNSTSNSLSVNTAGEYSVRVISNNGKEAKDTVIVDVSELPAPSLGADQTSCTTCQVVLDAGAGYASYLWSTNETTQTITVNTSGTYSVVVKNAYDCEGSDEVNVMLTTGVNEANTSLYNMSASPNPFTSETNINITLKQNAEVNIEITDLSGRKVATLVNGSMIEGSHAFGFIPSQYGLTSGVYILKASIGDVSSKIKLVNY